MRTRRPTLAPAVALLVAVVALGGCTTAEPQQPRTAAIVLPALDGRFQDVADILEDRLEAGGYEVEVHGTDGDIPAQVTVVDELLDGGVDALVVWPIDGTSLTPIVDDALGEQVIVSMGALLRDTPALDLHVGFDARTNGATQATQLLQGLGLLDAAGTPVADPPPGPFRIELFAGSPDNAATAPGYEGAMSVLEPYLESGDVVVGSGETALDDVTTLRGNDETAASRLTRILRESYDGGVPDAVLATSDRIAQGVAGVLADAGAVSGAGFPVVTGRGAELRSLVAILDGRQYATVLEDSRRLADAVADVLLEGAQDQADLTVDNGAAAIPAVQLAGEPVVAADLAQDVVGSGYWTQAQLDDAIAEYGLGGADGPDALSG